MAHLSREQWRDRIEQQKEYGGQTRSREPLPRSGSQKTTAFAIRAPAIGIWWRPNRCDMQRSLSVPLPRSFYARPAIEVARDLLGCTLVHVDHGVRRSGRIVETEAYLGVCDRACHASRGRTKRTEVMFGEAGHAYVYLIYGMYHCFNVVCDSVGVGAAVLVRALAPAQGCLGETNGPGKVCRSLRITRANNVADLTRSPLFIEPGDPLAHQRVEKGPRIGVDYAGAWARRLLRFWIAGEPCMSTDRSSRRSRS